MKLNNYQILILDDDEEMHIILGKILENIGVKILNSHSVEEAIKTLEYQKPHLILADINMTPLDGFEFLKYVKQHEFLRDIPVIMLSIKNEKETIFKCISMGARDYILKPINSQILITKIRKILHNCGYSKYVFKETEPVEVVIDTKIKSFSKNIICIENKNYFKSGNIIKLDVQSKDQKNRFILPCLITEEPKKIFFNNYFQYDLIPIMDFEKFENIKKMLGIYE